MNARNAQTLLLLAGVCLLCSGLLFGCASGEWYNPLNWFGGPDTHGAAAGYAGGGGPGGVEDATGLVAIFGWWSWACIAFAVVSFISAFFVRIIPGNASIGALLLGVALGIAKGFIVKYVWTLYLGFGVGLLVFAIPIAVTGYRYLKAKLTGKPIAGRVILKLPKRKGKPDVDQRADSGGGAAGGVVRAAQAGPEPSGAD